MIRELETVVLVKNLPLIQPPHIVGNLRKAQSPREYSSFPELPGAHRQELNDGTRKESKAFAAKSRVESFLEFNNVFLGRFVVVRTSA